MPAVRFVAVRDALPVVVRARLAVVTVAPADFLANLSTLIVSRLVA